MRCLDIDFLGQEPKAMKNAPTVTVHRKYGAIQRVEKHATSDFRSHTGQRTKKDLGLGVRHALQWCERNSSKPSNDPGQHSEDPVNFYLCHSTGVD
jgi:hypothetical protein